MWECFFDYDICKDVFFVYDGKYIILVGGVKLFEVVLYLVEYLYGVVVVCCLVKGLVIDWDLSEVFYLVVD